MVRKLSDYIIETLTPVEEIEAPITCNKLDQMIPKKVDGHYLNYIKTQFMDRKLTQDFLQLSGAYPTLPQKFGSKKFK